MADHWIVRCLIYLLVVTFNVLASSSEKCLRDRPDVSPKRHFYYNGTNLAIRIETSDRSSHQLVSRLLRILLIEVLGYDKVELVQGYGSTDPQLALQRLSSSEVKLVPPSTVNMEVWIPAGFSLEDWLSSGQIVSGGPLGTFGRYGWYMPSYTVATKWNHSHAILDHWKMLKLPEVTNMFSLNDKSDSSSLRSTDYPPRRGASCEDTGNSAECRNFVAAGQRCSTANERCASLLIGDQDIDVTVLRRQIDALDLHVKPLRLPSSRLNSLVRQRTSNNHPTLFFNWVPNDATAARNFSRVHFPLSCHDGVGSESPFGNNVGFPPSASDCDYDVHQLTKVVWSMLKSRAPEAFHVVSKINFSQSGIEKLLLSYAQIRDMAENSEQALETTACEWIRRHKSRWSGWLPATASSKVPIYLGGMFPLSGPYWRQPAILEGAKMAVEYVNSDPAILRDYELILLVQDTQCKVDIAMKHFVQYISNTTHPIAGIVGPACSETAEPIAGVSKHFNTIVISYSAEALQLTNRETFPLFFRTIPHILQNGEIFVGLFELWKWEQAGLLSEEGQNYAAYHGFLKDLFFSRSILVPYDHKMPRQATPDDATKYLDELRVKQVKIIILTSFEQSARAVLCEAYRKGMTAAHGYVWFLPTWFTRFWWHTDRFNTQFNERVPCTTAQMNEAVQGHFSLNTAFLGPEDSYIVGNCTVRKWLDAYVDRIDELDMEFSPYASYAYDAVLVFALGLNKLLDKEPSAVESLHSQRTVQNLMSYLNKTYFAGASGPVQFAGADRTGIINIEQYIGNSTVQIGQFIPDRNVSERLNLNESIVKWLSGTRPTDGRAPPKRCSVEAFRALLGVECDVAVVIINVIGIGVFIVIMLISLLTVKRSYDAKMRATRVRMEELGLLPGDCSMFCLDAWEVAREHVVLNRKLGEGAFGTVYGGEVCFGDTWVAVAVKTLKIGSTAEDKLDFLSEAEMMKKFEHKNIVKLIGVCTRGEPAYTIMEFMLHGDLKTFLLSRRQLVNELSRESEDIGPLGLTQMSLDVANGLKYLSSLNYVHRDVASRNCLVHTEKTIKVIKIGDFGMTRPMYDNDYYKFNKRGMFPVRWMAPESLTDGIFGTFSDVWSYGVLIYEIMTFGSFPYQGYSNRQVLNYVKAGNTINLPAGCPQKLRELLRCCWLYDTRSRPSVDDIIAILTDNPTLVVPCLDAPSTAVALEGTDSLEMNILPRMRHKNQYQKTTTGGTCTIAGTLDNKIARRGLSLSSPEADIKIAGSEIFDATASPDPAKQCSNNSFSVRAFLRLSDDRLNHVDGVNPGADCVKVLTRKSLAAGECETVEDAMVRSAALLSRSLSADDRVSSDPVRVLTENGMFSPPHVEDCPGEESRRAWWLKYDFVTTRRPEDVKDHRANSIEHREELS